jgi:hypothetical protein
MGKEHPMEIKRFLRVHWDRALAVTLIVIGAITLLVGWIGVSGTGYAAEQNPYIISGGLAGIAFIAVGCTLWMSADMQDEWRRLDRLERRLLERDVPVGTVSGLGVLDATEHSRSPSSAFES